MNASTTIYKRIVCTINDYMGLPGDGEERHPQFEKKVIVSTLHDIRLLTRTNTNEVINAIDIASEPSELISWKVEQVAEDCCDIELTFHEPESQDYREDETLSFRVYMELEYKS